uniref:Uncharacterized protein n=1 Tax=Rhizophora mucronata TaxID=61149 RepID=A0A2P2PJB9_RHIMU
MENYLFELE